MTSGDEHSGAGDGTEPRQPSFNWGLTPTDPEEASQTERPERPEQPPTPESAPPTSLPTAVTPQPAALEVPLPPLTPAPTTPPPAAPAVTELPGLLKLPPLPGESSQPAVPQAAAAQPTPPASAPAPLVEPPATEAMNVADLPTSAMNVSDLPTGAMDISDLPTGAMDVADLPTAALTTPTRRQSYLPAAVDPALEGATELIGAQSLDGISAEAESVEHDAVGALFGEDKFVEYEDETLIPPASALVVRERTPAPPRPPIPRGQVIGLAIAGGLVAALALIALFLAGTRIGENSVPAAGAGASATPTAQPTVAAPVVGPVDPGIYQWNELAGGECLEPFASAWEQEYTVVECAQPHAAQLLTIGQFDDAAADPYPDAEQLASRTAQSCSTNTVIDFAAAQSFADLEIVASFAATAQEWEAGDRNYYCFATRAGDDALTASVAQPQTPDN
ncbi:septum formation family protein [Rhodoglobus sp. NPDC076762]